MGRRLQGRPLLFSQSAEVFLSRIAVLPVVPCICMVGRAREMYLSTGICGSQLERSVRFSCLLQVDPVRVLGSRGLKGATLHGIPGQGTEVYRLRC